MTRALKRLLLLTLVSTFGFAAQAGLDIKANVVKLGELSKTAARPNDEALLQALALIDRSTEDSKISPEVLRLVRAPRFQSSRHVAPLAYFMLVNNPADPAWWNVLREVDGGPFFFPALLVRLDQMKSKDPSGYKQEAAAAVAWLKSMPEDTLFFGPELKGASVWGVKPRAVFTDGALPKLVKKREYVAATVPLPGFNETNIYLVLLDANKDSDATLEEMARIYLRTGKTKTAAANFFELGNRRFNGRQFMEAKNYYQRANSLDGETKQYATALDKANLELLYDAPAEPATAASPAAAPPAPKMTGAIVGKNVNLRAAPSILGEPLDKVSEPLDVQVLEVYVAEDASEGLLKKDTALAAEDGTTVDLKSGKAVFIVSDLGDAVIINVTVGDKKHTGRVPADAVNPTAGGKWYKIEANNRVGWVFGNFLKEK